MPGMPTSQAQKAVLTILSTAPVDRAPFDLPTVRAAIETLRKCVEELNMAAQIDESLATLIGDSVTQSAYPVLFLVRQREFERASQMFVNIWQATLEALEPPAELVLPPIDLGKPESVAEELEFLSVWNVAISEVLRSEVPQGEARQVLRRLAVHLELSLDQLGMMFGVSGETVRRWERGLHPIPNARIAKLISADRSLSRLLQIFRPERLAQVIRRKADLFEGERALDWILRARQAEVADRYENALMYQAS